LSGEDFIVSSQMDTKSLFLETVGDLRRRSSDAHSEYEAVISALLLRKLLLDSPTLIDVANQESRLKITYVVNARPPIWKHLGEEPPLAYAKEDGFDPEIALVPPIPVEMKRDELLSQVVVVYRGKELSVRDLIDYVAHVAGGVHFKTPKTEEQAGAQALAEQMTVGGYPAGTRTLLAVGRVVVRGLEPLCECLRAEGSL
jgi:hypothetical protein